MMHRRIAVPAFLVALTFPGIGSAPARSLGFTDWLEAQRAIERIYYSHQVGAVRPFEEAVPQELLERKVRTYLKQSAALEKYWNTPVTGEALQRELERIAAATRSPDRLREIYQALGNDPVLIQECFARPVLVDRLARNFLAYDERVQGAAKEKLRTLPDLPERGTATTNGVEASIVEIVKRDTAHVPRADADEASRILRDGRIELDAEEFSRWRSRAPDTPGETSPIQEERDAFVVRQLLREDASSARIASFSSPKISWNSWWSAVEADLDETSIQPVASQEGVQLLPGAPGVAVETSSCVPPPNSWSSGALDAPHPLRQHTAVWTGSLMIVWGGTSFHGGGNDGARYDPLTDSWSPTSLVGAPVARSRHTAVWTGSEMIIWGGVGAAGDVNSKLNSGGRYNPLTDSWVPTAPDAVSSRYDHVAIWSGSRMVVWGGFNGIYLADGGQYDPALDEWTVASLTGAPPGAANASAVWTGSRMIVWGGTNSAFPNGTNTGGVYDPATNTWIRNTSLAGAPTARTGHTAIWSGSRMIVWGGGSSSTLTNTGGRYDPVADTWQALSTLNPPQARKGHTAVWTGSVMVVWGGSDASAFPSTTFPIVGGRYDPVADTWQATSSTNGPTGRSRPTAIWTGSRMIVWGGQDNFNLYGLNTGGRYDPVSDTWTPTFSVTPPGQRQRHTAVWTGNQMIVWGGMGGVDSSLHPYLNTGARYDPLTDAWAATSTASAPSPRIKHTAVWTGSRMIVFGGNTPAGSFINTGGEYDPVTDSWVATPLNPFTFTSGAAAVWTGSRMLVWGGSLDRFVSIYDPAARTWAKSSTVNAPSPGNGGTAVWTGTEMIVWGGSDNQTIGGRYNPATNTWTSVSTTDDPSPRVAHTAVWTGTEMIIWGGDALGDATDTGARYDPQSDHWRGMFATGAPSPRLEHTAVWTGMEMIVWGGAEWFFNPGFQNGARFDPALDRWTPISTIGAAPRSSRHTAVWTGSEMLIWGGTDDEVVLSSGDRYAPQGGVDLDGDGFTGCLVDCDDSNPAVYPGAPPICDGVSNDCNAPNWPALAGTTEVDDDGDSLSECQGDCDDTRAAVYPGAPQVCDGVNNNCSAPGWPSLIGTNEADDDADSMTECQGDCDDTRAAVYPGAPPICDGVSNDCNASNWPALAGTTEADDDGDSLSECQGDCNDASAAVRPGAPQICDGVNNNCSAPGWPSLTGTNEADDDADSMTECQGDCDDANPSTYAGAAEVNDARDNQCPTYPGYGIIDELSDPIGFTTPADPGELSWAAQPGATGYEVQRSASPIPNLNPFLLSTVVAEPRYQDPTLPPVGSALFYLARPISPHAGSWGQKSNGQERVGLANPESSCSNSADDDGDGLSDCADPDCIQASPCAPAEFSFTDTFGDDITPESFTQFLTPLSVAPTDYLFFSLTGSGIVDDYLCTQRADFYRTSYLDLAASGGSASSGPWSRWTLQEGGVWTGPDTGSYLNLYGFDCIDGHAWCPEPGLAGRNVALLPEQTTECESLEFSMGCSSGAWRLTVKIGQSRLTTCGF